MSNVTETSTNNSSVAGSVSGSVGSASVLVNYNNNGFITDGIQEIKTDSEEKTR